MEQDKGYEMNVFLAWHKVANVRGMSKEEKFKTWEEIT
jgi:hypothetical protein